MSQPAHIKYGPHNPQSPYMGEFFQPARLVSRVRLNREKTKKAIGGWVRRRPMAAL